MSLNQRIIISAGVVLFFFITITAAALNSAYVESSENALRKQLTSQLYALMAAAEVDREGVVLPTDELDSLLGLPSSGLYAFVTDSKQNVLWQSSSVLDADPPEPMVLTAGDKHFYTYSKQDKNYWIHAYGVNWAYEDNQEEQSSTQTIALTFNIITDLAGYQASIDEYRDTLWRWLLGMAAFLIITQAIILRWGLSPLRKVSAELNEIESGSQEQIENNYPKEIKRLTDSINTLLMQERNQKTRYRNALGDLAHSLKTPLAVLQSSIDKQADGAPHGDETQNVTLDNDTQANVRQQLERMNSIVEYQLQRAATAGAGGTGQALNIRALFERIIDSLQKVYRDKNLVIDLDIDAQLTITADEGDMMELFGNLLDNACKWAESRVEIRYFKKKQRHRLTVSDDGPGIAPDLAEELLKRGVRADESISGHGIGLSIVRDIVDAYHGEMHIGRSESGGTEIAITL